MHSSAKRARIPLPADPSGENKEPGFGAFRDLPEENAAKSKLINHPETLHFSLDKPNGRFYLGNVIPTNPTSEAARILGSVRSPKKAKAARENGKLGGRPPKKKKAQRAKA